MGMTDCADAADGRTAAGDAGDSDGNSGCGRDFGRRCDSRRGGRGRRAWELIYFAGFGRTTTTCFLPVRSPRRSWLCFAILRSGRFEKSMQIGERADRRDGGCRSGSPSRLFYAAVVGLSFISNSSASERRCRSPAENRSSSVQRILPNP